MQIVTHLVNNGKRYGSGLRTAPRWSLPPGAIRRHAVTRHDTRDSEETRVFAEPEGVQVSRLAFRSPALLAGFRAADDDVGRDTVIGSM